MMPAMRREHTAQIVRAMLQVNPIFEIPQNFRVGLRKLHHLFKSGLPQERNEFLDLLNTFPQAAFRISHDLQATSVFSLGLGPVPFTIPMIEIREHPVQLVLDSCSGWPRSNMVAFGFNVRRLASMRGQLIIGWDAAGAAATPTPGFYPLSQ